MPLLSTFSTLSSRGYKGSGVIKTLTVNYLLIAGGGGGNDGRDGDHVSQGAGGAGGYSSGTALILTSVNDVNITVGLGGAHGGILLGINYPQKGFDSILNYGTGVITSIGGGAATALGRDGGSGAGANDIEVAGSGTAGQGFSGANGFTNSSCVGGGGGAGGAGSIGSATLHGNGGIGKVWPIAVAGGDGATRGGGGGGYYALADGTSPIGGTGGTGGGGQGATTTRAAGNGTANTGGGGGGGYASIGWENGGNGGSGVCIISYAGTVQKATGGTITTANSLTYHTFNSSGTFTLL